MLPKIFSKNSFSLFGSVFILLGFLIANRVVDKLDDRRMGFAVYTAVGVSGILNLLGL